MTQRRLRWIAAAVAAMVLAAGAMVLLWSRTGPAGLEPRPEAERPELLLLTSLPIVFPEEFTIRSSGAPALDALQNRYRVVPISVADGNSLASHKLLLMAQPRAQPGQVLVELDQWMREGGRVLLLADPVLEWPSDRPLGDVLRPPMAFADTGLLGHWGLRLDAPDSPGPATFTVDGERVHTLSPGTLVATGTGCTVTNRGLIARCSLGRGEAVVIADADFADVERRRGPARSGNLDFLIRELAELER